MVKLIKLSIREFALPSPLRGSIDSDSGFGRATEQGIEIHQKVQEKNEKTDPDYSAEVKITHSFEREGFTFQIEGRMDGIFATPGKTPHIQEIKSSFSLSELIKTLEESDLEHPYHLQLLTYGYFYLQNEGTTPDLSFHLVSSRNYESKDLRVKLRVKAYEEWLEKRLTELVKEAKNAEKRTLKRKKLAEKFDFPFDHPRSGQLELVKTIEEGLITHSPMMIQAPTGLGKTMGVMYPALKEALARGKSVIYATPKNSQHQVAEDAIEKFQEKGAALKSLTLTAKTKLCMKAEPLCNPRYCEFAKDYYEKLGANDLQAVLAKKKKLSAKTFKKLAEEFEVCPFELQLEAVKEADVVICDYNYVFSSRSALKRAPRFELGDEGKPNLVIDEAHNLPSRAMSYYSPALSVFHLKKIKEDMAELPSRFRGEAFELADECISIVESLRPKSSRGSAAIEVSPRPFLEHETKLRNFLTRYLESDVEIEPKDPVLALNFYWSEFTQILDDISQLDLPEFFTLYLDSNVVKITCCDASKMLKDSYSDYENVVAFSATLKPFEYYSILSGLASPELKTAEFKSPFDRDKRKVLIIPQVSTKFQERDRNYPRIAEAISRIAALKSGNYLAFFPSFDFLEKVAQAIRVPPGTRLMTQERKMTASQIEETLDFLKSETVPTILFGVQGGVFSEGVDYPGNMVIGAFVVGPPLPTFDLERETMRKYYEETYRAGFDYAYTYPAMAKAVQAAGRVIRSEKDKGIIVLLDARFLETNYVKTMPEDWFNENPKELVSKQIVADVNEFWNKK